MAEVGKKLEVIAEPAAADAPPPLLDYAICTPYWGARDGDHLDCMNRLHSRYGFPRYRIEGCSYIDMARAALARIVEVHGHAGLMFIDHDILFDPDDVAELIATAERERCVVSGVYCMRATGDRIIGCFDASVDEVTCFEGGGLYPGPWSGLGFTAIPRKVLDDVGKGLPRLKTGFFEDVLPMFELRSLGDMTLMRHLLEAQIQEERSRGTLTAQGARRLEEILDEHCPKDHGWYSGEDISFFHRVARAGHRLLIDTRPRLGHKGSYVYGLEDAQIAVPRARSLQLRLVRREDAPLIPATAEGFNGKVGAPLQREARP